MADASSKTVARSERVRQGGAYIHAADVQSHRVRLGGCAVIPCGVPKNASAKADPTEYHNRLTTSVAMIYGGFVRPAAFRGLDAPVNVVFAGDNTGDKPAPDDSASKRKHPKPSPGNPFPATQPATAATPPVHQPTVDTTAGAEPRAEGNAIYKIDPDGFVTEVFRQPVLILSMVENNGTLVVATGGAEGQVYQVRPAQEETLVLAKVDPKEIMCLLAARDGKVYMGTANVGTVASMSIGFAAKGSYSSPVLDATQISRFGKIHLHGTLPTATTLTVATRSGNVKEADEKTWSKWSDEAPAAEFMNVMSPSARFLQYRLTFASSDGKATPVVRDVSTAYQMPNMAPRIKAIKLATSALSADLNADVDPTFRRVESARRQTIAWDASDPNNDALAYSALPSPGRRRGMDSHQG